MLYQCCFRISAAVSQPSPDLHANSQQVPAHVISNSHSSIIITRNCYISCRISIIVGWCSSLPVQSGLFTSHLALKAKYLLGPALRRVLDQNIMSLCSCCAHDDMDIALGSHNQQGLMQQPALLEHLAAMVCNDSERIPAALLKALGCNGGQ